MFPQERNGYRDREMKADWNDAPEHIQKHARKRRRGVAKLIPWLIGTVISIGLLQAASYALLTGTAQSIVDKRTQPKPAPVAEITRAEPTTTKDWDRVVESVAARGATPRPQSDQIQADTADSTLKQTVFNDKNYVPQGATNIVPATRVAPEAAVLSLAGQKKIVVVGKERRLSDFCPYKEGSIERRNCKANINLNVRR